MLNLFAATGYINYAKSARLYLQQMLELPMSHPWLHSKLSTEGHFFIRRTDEFWAGLWPDLVIEQVLMRSIKNRGGLTRGRGMSESVCMLWIRSMHCCGMMHQAMASLTNHTHSTSDQHEELGKSRISRDQKDFDEVAIWINEMNPFDANRVKLQSLTSGLTANEHVDCDNAETVGQNIQNKLDDQIFLRCSVKRGDQVTSSASMKNIVKVNKQSLNIDPLKLFTRLLGF